MCYAEQQADVHVVTALHPEGQKTLIQVQAIKPRADELAAVLNEVDPSNQYQVETLPVVR